MLVREVDVRADRVVLPQRGGARAHPAEGAVRVDERDPFFGFGCLPAVVAEPAADGRRVPVEGGLVVLGHHDAHRAQVADRLLLERGAEVDCPKTVCTATLQPTI